MIKFLFKGILRDRQRSLLPIITVSIGVFFTVVMSTWLTGILGDVVDMSAKFSTGHVKIMTKPYAELKDQFPNDLAILGVEELEADLNEQFPDMEWVNRIKFGGLLDVPDEKGETRAQGPVAGMAIDLLSPETKELDRMNINKSLKRGKLPSAPKEILISDSLAYKLELEMGDRVTFIGATMDGSPTYPDFKVVGTVSFGTAAMDRGAFIVDIADAQKALDMEDAASELLGFFSNGKYVDEEAQRVTDAFNAQYKDSEDEFAPIMFSLREQDDLAQMIDYSGMVTGIFVFIFVFAMSIVLWNMGLLGGLRRYNEFGLRLALGESKRAIYTSMIYESILIGIVGSSIGTALGLAMAFYLQEVGVDFSSMVKNIGMMMPGVYRARIEPSHYFVGFIPGLLSMVLGSALSGIGIYKRQTAQLFKELEV